MTFTTAVFFYTIFIIIVFNVYNALLASRISNTAKFDTTDAQTSQIDQVECVKQIHENKIIGNAILAITNWINTNKLIPLEFNAYSYCHRALSRNIILQLFSQQHQSRLNALFHSIYDETDTGIARSVAKIALVAIDLDDPTTLSVLTEALLTCNSYCVFNFIQSSVDQNVNSLPHISKTMEFESLLDNAPFGCHGNGSKLTDTLDDNKQESTERIAVSVLERISRLQAAAGFIVPTSIHDIADEKSGRRISNSSTLTSNSGISSYISSSVSSSSSSNTSITNYADIVGTSTKEFTRIDYDMLQPNEATYYDIIKFKTDLFNIRLEADHLLNHDIQTLAATMNMTKDTERSKQVDQAFRTLILTCIATEQALNNLQTGFGLDQLATHIVSPCIDEAMSNLCQQSKIKTYYQENFIEITTSLHKAMTISLSLLQAFPIRTDDLAARHSAIVDTFVERHTKIASALDTIDNVWSRVSDIRSILEDCNGLLGMISYTPNNSIEILQAHMDAVQAIFTTVYLCNIEKLEPLYNDISQQIKSKSNSCSYQHEDKIIVAMVTDLFKQVDSMKLKIIKTSQDLIHLHDRQEVKANISRAKDWLKAMNYSLGLFIALDALFSFDSINADFQALQDIYNEFQENYSEFTLTKYDQICNYFAQDYDSGLNYQKLGDTVARSKVEEFALFDDLQSIVDRTSKLLAFAHQTLMQRKAITEYVQLFNAFQNIADKDLLFQQCQLAVESFNNIQFPQLDIAGLSNMFYYYQHDLYLCLSESKIRLINSCGKI